MSQSHRALTDRRVLHLKQTKTPFLGHILSFTANCNPFALQYVAQSSFCVLDACYQLCLQQAQSLSQHDRPEHKLCPNFKPYCLAQVWSCFTDFQLHLTHLQVTMHEKPKTSGQQVFVTRAGQAAGHTRTLTCALAWVWGASSGAALASRAELSGTEPSSVVTLCATPTLAISSSGLVTPEMTSPEAELVASMLLKLSWLAWVCMADADGANLGMGTGVLVLTDVIGLLTTFVCST